MSTTPTPVERADGSHPMSGERIETAGEVRTRSQLIASMTPDDIVRFWSYVEKTGTCWLWTGALTKRQGYGYFTIRRRSVLAHRASWAIAGRAESPLLDHACRNRACVNPDHLRPLTNRENVLAGIGPSALNARKTHCPSGHPYTTENTYVCSQGKRYCRTCRVATVAAYKARLRVRTHQIGADRD